MHWLEAVLALSRPATIALAKLLGLTGLAAIAGVVQWLGATQKKNPATVGAVTMLAAGAYTAVFVGSLVLISSSSAWRVPVGLGMMLLAAASVFMAQRMWRRPALARAVGSSSTAIAAQARGPVETVWLRAASADPDDAAWPQLTRVTSPRNADALIVSPDFLDPNEHRLYRTRLFFGRGIPEMADASVVVTEARLLITDGQQVFAIPRSRLRAIAYREKEPSVLRAKSEAIVFTYATESGDRDLAGYDPGVFYWSSRAAKTHKTFEALRDALTSSAEPPAAA